MYKTIIHSSHCAESDFRDLFSGDPNYQWSERAGKICVTHEHILDRQLLGHLRDTLKVDINSIDGKFSAKAVKLFISDMDSTLIAIECIDEIADFVNVKAEVAAITESAMAGEIDFATSLKKRVALLKGLPQQQLQRVYDERLRLNPGVEKLLQGLKKLGIKTALVSGGFTFFSERLQSRLQLDFQLANVLGVENNILNGKVVGDIVTGERKAEFLQSLCRQLDISPQQAIAAGDGANDLPMLRVAGLGVAFRAKPVLQEKADIVINHGGMDTILDLLEE